MLWAFRFLGGEATPCDAPQLAGKGADGWAWTHFGLGDIRAQGALRALADLPAEAQELFTAREDRLVIDHEAGWTFGVLPDFERDFSGKTVGEGRLYFGFDACRLITGRVHPLKTVGDWRRRVERGQARPDSPMAALALIIELYLDNMEDVFDDLDIQLALIEDRILADQQDPGDAGLSPTRRTLARYRRELQGLKSALSRAQGGRHSRRAGATADWIAELAPWIEDVEREAAGLQDRARLLHEEIDTLINSATNRSVRALTIISTLLIPPTLIVGAFGMNVTDIPWSQGASGFAWASGLCVAVVLGTLWLLRRMSLIP